MQMYGNEHIEVGHTIDKNPREKRKKTHRKSRDDLNENLEPVNGSRKEEFDNTLRISVSSRRRSEEENYEPENENKRKHRHRRSRLDDDEAVGEANNVGPIRDCDDQPTVEEHEEARRLRREKKKRARERKKSQEDSYQNLQSPTNDVCDYNTNKSAETHYPDLHVPFEDDDRDSLQEEDLHVTPPLEDPKPKKKVGGFGKLLASFKKNKGAKADKTKVHEQWQSTPELFNPTYDGEPSTFKKSTKKIQGKSARDIPIRKTHVILLDGEEVAIDVDVKATGAYLFDKVCEDLDLIEKDFFGMTYVNSKLQTWFWLEMDKKISKQLGKDDEWMFNFQVKFYPPEPVLLQEDLTRYLLSLQVRQDVYTGKLPCSWITQALLGSFMVQSEIGDYDEIETGGTVDYLREFEFVLNQSEQLLEKICELHKKLVDMPPIRADIKFMETAKKLEQYGVDLHPARDNDDVEIFIGVSYQGILIYRDRLRIGRFAWPKVLRISYKKNYFYLKIRSDRYDDSVAIVGFKLFNHHLAKRLWKNAAEQHTFFRMKEPQMEKVGSKLVPSTSSGSGYSGKTLHQYRTMNISRAQPAHFERSSTKRRIGSMPAGLNRAGMQYSSMHSLNRAHPRDMTLGKTKSVEYLSSKRPGSAMALGSEREGSLGSFNQSRQIAAPYGSGNSFKDDDRHQSFRSGDSLNGGDSYTVNHDDQMSLPSMSRIVQPIKKDRSKVPSSGALSDDGIISPLPRDRVKPVVKSSKMAPLPKKPDPESSDSSESMPMPQMKKPQFVPAPNQNRNRPPPQFKAPPPLPDPILEPPSTSSSVRSSPTERHMPPPPSTDLNSYTETELKTTFSERSKPPPVKPKPTVKPKPVRTVVATATSRRREDDML